MLAQYLDLTDEFANSYNGSNYSVNFEVSNYDYVLVQFIGFLSEVSFKSTIDSGAVQRVTDGSALTSDNYVPAYATYLLDNSKVTVSPDNGVYRFDVVGRYIRLQNTAGLNPTTGKLLVTLTKIS
jgi:hypothetical protein